MSGADPYNSRQAYFFFNLGCPKNIYDAERVAGLLEAAGWREAESPERADLLVVTTCAFIARAEEESVEEILRVASGKRSGQRLAVLGCLVSREGRSLRTLFPEVDIFLSVGEMGALPELVGAARPSLRGTARPSPRGAAATDEPVMRKPFTPPHIAYLKIAEGCSNRCSYCTIPSIRGPLRSRARREIVAEAAALIARGVREIVLVAQDSAAYGVDREEERSLWDLTESLAAAAKPAWLRLMYLHPSHIDIGRLVSLLGSGAITRYVDIPVQHASDGVLGRMNRPYGSAHLARLFGELRSRVDSLVMRTTVMVGFPGETTSDFDELVAFLDAHRFDHVGVFVYSPERGTPAEGFAGAVEAEEAERRRDELLEMQMDISHERLLVRLGREETVLVDEELSDEDSPRRGVVAAGRFYGQAYEVDGVTFLSGRRIVPGTFVRVRVEEAHPYDLFARVI